MKVESNSFIKLADIILADDTKRAAIASGTHTAFNSRLKAMFSNGEAHGEAMRQQAATIKRHALNRLPDLLERAEQTLTTNGFQVLWAEDSQEARRHVLDIVGQHQVQSVIKSKSMVTEEVALNDDLIAAGIRVLETDLGEYIIQLAEEHPSHIIAPVIHKSKEEIRQLFRAKLNMPDFSDAESMVGFARQKLREDFLSADMGVSGANFIIADTGSLCLVTNEGNGRMVTTMPRVHVALVGLEKVIESLEDYALLTQILPRSATGQQMPVYTNIVNGPCQDGGPEHLYVIFVDNGRSEIYASGTYSEALACIRCGACLNACPVYRSVGGHTYGWVYGGPIGAVITPLLKGLDQAHPLPQASSLCGSCKQVCPVNIDLPRMLLALRHDWVDQHGGELKWNVALRGWQMAHTSPTRFELSGKLARVGLNIGADRLVPTPLGAWKEYRDFPEFAAKPFRKQWRERKKGNQA
jgi:L-lactate dehydrogenase complex protein LldF